MNRFLRLLLATTFAALVVATPAAAAAPANDTFAGAVTISALPFSDTLDTTQATTDADDAEANANCGAPATEASVDFAFVDVSVTQRVGRFTITGFGGASADPCDGLPHPWSVDVTGSNGTFAGGQANVDALIFACGAIGCVTDEATQAIRLRPR